MPSLSSLADRTADDTILHVGPGALRGLQSYPRTAATVVLVEAGAPPNGLLALKAGRRPNVRIEPRALRPNGGGEEVLTRYNLPDLDGFAAPTGAGRLFPGLRVLGRETVATIGAEELLEGLPAPGRNDLLIIEAAGEERAILEALDGLGALDRFGEIVLRTGRTPLFEGAGCLREIDAWLRARRYGRPVICDESDPDWPIIHFALHDAVSAIPAAAFSPEGEGGIVARPGHLARQLEEYRAAGRISDTDTRIFRTQLDLLRHELSLALARGQLGSGRAPPEGEEEDEASLRSASVSQLGQDLWVLEQTNRKRGGFFVEFGATDGLHLSNTWLLEKRFGWTGQLAEPNPAFFQKLKANRDCVVTSCCIHSRTGETVEFVLADEYGTIARYAASDGHEDTREAFSRAGRVIEVETVSLDDFLKRHDAPRKIDYVSIDTEGSEFDILEAFPFAEWDIRLFTVEHNDTPNRERVRALMERHGYACQPAGIDDWFCKDAGA